MITITKKQKKTYSKIGNQLIKKNLTTGFQLEDFDKKKENKPQLIYVNDSKKNLKKVNGKLKGKILPRESYYKWDKSWTAGPETTLLFNKTLANAQEKYIDSNPDSSKIRYVSKNTVRTRGNSVPESWIVPDVRLYNKKTNNKEFKKAYLITKDIDSNSRLSIIATKKKNKDKICKELKGEKVRTILIQNYKPKRHSLWSFINNQK